MDDSLKKFREYVDNVLASELRGSELGERVFGKTPKGRHFAIITTSVSFFYYLLYIF